MRNATCSLSEEELGTYGGSESMRLCKSLGRNQSRYDRSVPSPPQTTARLVSNPEKPVISTMASLLA